MHQHIRMHTKTSRPFRDQLGAQRCYRCERAERYKSTIDESCVVCFCQIVNSHFVARNMFAAESAILSAVRFNPQDPDAKFMLAWQVAA